MSTLLDLPEVRARVSRLSVEAYEALTEMGALNKREELIRGLLVTKMSKSPLHCKLCKRIYDGFRARQRAGFIIFQERPLRLHDSVPEPDAMIVLGQEGAFDDHHPTAAALVVEVAVSSAGLDRENATLYAEAGVPEYWIVLGSEQQVEVYRQPENGVYQQKILCSGGETLACTSVTGLEIPLAEWFA